MHERAHLHDGEQLLCSMRCSGAALIGNVLRAIAEGLIAGVIVGLAAGIVLFFMSGAFLFWPLILAMIVGSPGTELEFAL